MIIEFFAIEDAPDQGRCHFCYAPEIRCRYPCRSFAGPAAEGTTGPAIEQRSVGDWAACDCCHALIEAGGRQALAERSYDTPHAPAEYQELKRRASRQDLRAYFRVLHDQFFSHRTAPAVPEFSRACLSAWRWTCPTWEAGPRTSWMRGW